MKVHKFIVGFPRWGSSQGLAAGSPQLKIWEEKGIILYVAVYWYLTEPYSWQFFIPCWNGEYITSTANDLFFYSVLLYDAIFAIAAD